jgi:hypothetical protein
MPRDDAPGRASSSAATILAKTEPAPKGGWDPYEVWRTRVLLPRLEDRRPSEPADHPPKPRLVRSA